MARDLLREEFLELRVRHITSILEEFDEDGDVSMEVLVCLKMREEGKEEEHRVIEAFDRCVFPQEPFSSRCRKELCDDEDELRPLCVPETVEVPTSSTGFFPER